MRHTLMLLAALFVLLSGCASHRAPTGSLQHVVLFSLKNPEDTRALGVDAFQLMQCPVRSVTTGPRRAVDDRASDEAFDAGVTVTFDTAADYRAFMTHPSRLWFMDRWRPRCTSIRTFDFGYACDSPAAKHPAP